MPAPTESDRSVQEALHDFILSVFGPTYTTHDRSRPFGRASLLWEIEGPHGVEAYLKQHEERRLYERARAAYQDWLPQLACPAGTAVPRLIAHDDDLGAMIITGCRGYLVESVELEQATLRTIHARAGAFMGALHALPLAEEVDAGAELGRRISDYLTLSEGAVPPVTLDWAREQLSDPLLTRPEPAVACHMDFTPRNWIARGHGEDVTLTVIDWERARPDHRMQVVQRLDSRYWSGRPDCRKAFFDAIGWFPSREDQRVADLLNLLDTIAGIRWARAHSDRAFEELLNQQLVVWRRRLR